MLRLFLLRLLVMAALGSFTFAGLWAYSIWRRTTPAQKVEALRQEVASKGGRIFETSLQGRPLTFLLMGCELFVVDAAGEKVTQRKVLRAGFYYGLDSCTDQDIRRVGDFVEVYLANRAIGAGGGNTSGGSYRSLDGIKWEKQTTKGWVNVDQAQL